MANVSALFSLITAFLYLKLPESPHWLMSQGRVAEAKLILLKIARSNAIKDVSILETLDDNISTDSNLPLLKSAADNHCFISEEEDNDFIKGHYLHSITWRNETIADLLKHWLFTYWLLIQLFSWLCNSMVYYGLTMAAGNLDPNNLYRSVVLSGLAELPAYFVIIILQEKIGRRTLVAGSMLTAGTASLSIRWAGERTGVLLAIIGKTAISASFALVWLHSAELFPTQMRNAGLGLCSMAARVGGVLSPFVSLLANVYPMQEFVIFGAVGIIAGLLNLQLPETKGRPLPESIEDMWKLKY